MLPAAGFDSTELVAGWLLDGGVGQPSVAAGSVSINIRRLP